MGIRQHMIDTFFHIERTSGTYIHTATATHAKTLLHRLAHRSSNPIILPSGKHRQIMDILYIVANIYASAAFNTLIGVSDNGVKGDVFLIAAAFQCKRQVIYMVLPVKSLQLTDTIPNAVAEKAHPAELGVKILLFATANPQAVMAVHWVMGHDEFQRQLAVGTYSFGISSNYHTIPHLGGTGRLEGTHSFHLYNADSAGSARVQLFQKAQSRNMDSISPGGFQNGNPFCNLQLLIIYGNMDIRHLYFTILSAKSSGKFSYALTKAVNAP